MTNLRQSLVAETAGTFCLVFTGTGAIVVNSTTEGSVTTLGIAIVFGLIVMTMVCAIGRISGAHINPAVSIGFVLAGRMPIAKLLPYIIAQLVGALLASLCLRLIFPDASGLGATRPAGGWPPSLALEIATTAILMFVIMCVATGSKEQGITAGLAIGGVITLTALFAGPISGASLNPARSIGPAIIGGDLASLWIYIVGPCIGSAIGVGAWLLIHVDPDEAP